MKKIASLGEFKRYYSSRNPQKIIFCSENQDNILSGLPCKMRLSFSSMMISESPNQICIKDNSGVISLTKVCFVEINSRKSILGDVITVFCGDVGAQRPEVTYTLIAA